MDIRVPCFACVASQPNATPQLFAVDLDDDDLIWLTGRCDQGHDLRTLLQNERFELIFDEGLLAFGRGFRREAVLDFAAGWERLMEFYVKASMMERGSRYEQILTGWSMVSRQSERQLGWFLGAHLAAEQADLPALSDEAVRLRNRVAHGGHFPDREEAETCMDEIWRKSLDLRDLVCAKYGKGMDALLQCRIRSRKHFGTPVMLGPSMIGLRHLPLPHRSLDEALSEVAKYYRLL